MLQENVTEICENTHAPIIKRIKSEIVDLVGAQKDMRVRNPSWTSALNQEKMSRRQVIRAKHLAVAFLKDVPYKVLEKKSHDIIMYFMPWRIFSQIRPDLKSTLDDQDLYLRIKTWLGVV